VRRRDEGIEIRLAHRTAETVHRVRIEIDPRRLAARDQRVIAVFDPRDANAPRQRVVANFIRRAERIARALHDQAASLKSLQMFGAAGYSRDLPLERMTLVVGRGEPYLNIRHVVYGDFLAQARGLQEIDFSQAKSLPPFGPAVDVFGDNSLWALATPGHTVGHVSYLVNAQSGAELITGDACNLKEELKTGIGPGWFSTDVKQAQASFDEIKAFHKKYPQVKIQCGHEL